MNVLRRPQAMTQRQFLEWAGTRNERFEFDGFQPIAMTGGSVDHSRICRNVVTALERRLEDGLCEALPEAGIATVGDAVRCPDMLITCSKAPGTALLVPGAVVVFEVVSAGSVRTDHYVKVREYHAVASIQRYVILESASTDVTVLTRQDQVAEWAATTLTGEDTLHLPEVGVSIPVTELYSRVELTEGP